MNDQRQLRLFSLGEKHYIQDLESGASKTGGLAIENIDKNSELPGD